jgi:hypothetical protein
VRVREEEAGAGDDAEDDDDDDDDDGGDAEAALFGGCTLLIGSEAGLREEGAGVGKDAGGSEAGLREEGAGVGNDVGGDKRSPLSLSSCNLCEPDGYCGNCLFTFLQALSNDV